MPETSTFLPSGLSSKGLTILDKDGKIIELPPTTELNDMTIVEKTGDETSLPQGVLSSGLTLVDKLGNEYLIIDTLNDALNDANDLINPSLRTYGRLANGIVERIAKDTEEYRDDDLELADLNTVIMEEVEKDKFRKGNKKGDISLEDYSFDGNNVYAVGDAGVEIDGFLFFPEEVKGDESYARRDYTRTKIMSGGEFVTRGQYVPREYSFTTTLDIDPNEPYAYDKLFQIMENKPCEIVSPYMGDIFKAIVEIDKTHPKASPASLKLDITIKEIVDPSATVVGDTPIKYPSTTAVGDDAIDVRELTKHEPKSEEGDDKDKIRADSKFRYSDGREVNEDTNPLSNKNMNERIKSKQNQK